MSRRIKNLDLVQFDPFEEEKRPEITRAVIYRRQSHIKKGSGSLEEQEKWCRAFSKRNGWAVHERVFTDPGKSASRYATKPRDAYIELLEFLQPGDVLVAWKNNRIIRKMREAIDLRDICEERRCYIAYGNQIYDMTDSRHRAAFTRDAQASEEFSDNLSTDLGRNKRVDAANGMPHGRVAFGYRIIVDEETNEKTYRIDAEGNLIYREAHPKEAPIVREIFDGIEAEKKVVDMLLDLERRGITQRNGKPITRQLLMWIAKNPLYAGKRMRYGELVADGQWEPLISDEQFLAVQDVLERRAKYKTSYQRGLPRKYILSGLLYCGICHSKMQVAKGGKDRGDRYMCHKPRWHTVGRSKRFVEETVEKVIFDYVGNEEFVQQAVEDILGSPPEDEHDSLMHQIQELEDFVEDYRRSAADPKNGISAKSLAQIERVNEPKIRELYARANAVRLASSQHDPLLEFLMEDDPEDAWLNSYSTETKREIIRRAFHIEILPVGKGNPKSVQGIRMAWTGSSES